MTGAPLTIRHLLNTPYYAFLAQGLRAFTEENFVDGTGRSALDPPIGLEKAVKNLITVLVGALIVSASMVNSASAYVVMIDNFTVTKNGGVALNDSFDTGGPPPAGPSAAGIYGVNGTFAEGGGVATMTTATGSPTVFGGTSFIRHTATFLTNAQPLSVSMDGLKSDDALSVAGLFDLSIPTTNRESYGVYFTDRLGPGGSLNTGNDQLEMRLVKNQAGQVRIQFQRLDHVTQTSTGIQSILLETAVGVTALGDITNDQLLLKLEKLSDTSNVITASFEYFDNGSSLGVMSFANTASIFNGEDYTRAGFFARVAVAEPGTLMVFAFGLAGLGFTRRRQVT